LPLAKPNGAKLQKNLLFEVKNKFEKTNPILRRKT